MRRDKKNPGRSSEIVTGSGVSCIEDAGPRRTAILNRASEREVLVGKGGWEAEIAVLGRKRSLHIGGPVSIVFGASVARCGPEPAGNAVLKAMEAQWPGQTIRGMEDWLI